ncbi:MAG: 1-acyl-sn-glycerol-3-phosphate acyltransferase [Phycisphaerales bacterium]|nr:1-acyl-sn-glycerol-3-phosphate acyltransferase [Phycisphaerales bacterium]MCB9854556.1 1-acyl-sn-glycerol-3-phosphate acyltransferase [Phycisphaerales bacterium]MCB9863211.1 1-acyl-sn-glycerol-3-phosphate acyltransferase [Phycisphaerales bacterium]
MRLKRSLPWKCIQAFVRPLAVLLFDLKVDGQENIPAEGGVLIVSNHQSVLDPILLPIRLNRPFNYIAKSELFRNRMFAWFLRWVFNAFPVHQGHSDVKAVKETIRRLQAGHVMNIYPEGARTEDGEIGPLQSGVALIVERAQVAVVPAVIVGAFEVWPIHKRFFRRGPIRIRFGPPLYLAGLDREEILATIDRTLRSMFAALRAECSPSNSCRAKSD